MYQGATVGGIFGLHMAKLPHNHQKVPIVITACTYSKKVGFYSSRLSITVGYSHCCY